MIIKSTANDIVLEARNITVSYDNKKVLDVPSLEISANRVQAIIGPNGSGKTTLLLCLALLNKPTTGSILFRGKPVGSELLPLRRRFAVIFQEALLLNTTVIENVSLGMKMRGVEKEEINRRAQHWLERFGIAHLAKRNARTLSGGEAQRTSLARAFSLQPEILFLDEPFAALDAPTRQTLFGDVVNILQETRFTTVLITHDRNEAQTLADRVAVLMNGNILQNAPTAGVFSSPVNEEVARFIGVENVLSGKVLSCREGLANIEVGEYTVEAISDYGFGTRVKVCVRPEDITLSLSETPGSARNVLRGEITDIFANGPLIRITLNCGFPLIAMVTRLSASEMGLEKNKKVFASFKAAAVHIIKM